MESLKTYSTKFYKNQLTESFNSANYIVPIINNWFQPKTIVDVGCGVGAWLEVWKNQDNIEEIKGLDAKFVDKSFMRIDMDSEFLEVDLNKPLPELNRYDLAICLEVAEHLEESRANSFVEDLTKLSDVILFSAAIPGQEGTKHINEQFLSYWVEKFKLYDFKCYDVLRPIIWNIPSIAFWFRQNSVVFVKNGSQLNVDLNAMPSFNCFDLVQKDLLKYKERKYYKLLNKRNGTKKQLKAWLKKMISKS